MLKNVSSSSSSSSLGVQEEHFPPSPLSVHAALCEVSLLKRLAMYTGMNEYSQYYYP
jgi:hypothetical protein